MMSCALDIRDDSMFFSAAVQVSITAGSSTIKISERPVFSRVLLGSDSFTLSFLILR